MAEMLKRKDFLENEVVDLREEIALTSPTDTPLTTLLMGRGAVVPATDITVTWRERKLNETRGTLFGSCISLEYIKRSDYKGLRRQ